MSDPDASSAAAAPLVVQRAEPDLEPPPALGGPAKTDKPRSLGRDAWDDLRRRPIFWVSLVLIVIVTLMALVPGLFPGVKDPRACDLQYSRQPPSSDAWFGYDLQGCDVYSRTIYGARASVFVGFFATLSTMIIGSIVGVIAGFRGGWVDAVLSRITDIFFAIPLLLGGILVLTSLPSTPDTPEIVIIAKVVAALAILGWTSITRIMRSSVIQVKQADFVQAARALGGGSTRIIRKHVLPNSLAPVIVVSTIALGGYIGAEATLSYLGIGLQPPVVSWGIAISDAQKYVRQSPHMLLFPSVFLSLTVLAFIMLGDAVREALDPKLR
jgi:oligopeptide transport system permease protein